MNRQIAIPDINPQLVSRLVATQFPQWATLPIARMEPDGWDNRTFRLGPDLIVRIPSALAYASQVEKEQKWLPWLAPQLPLRIPEPVAIGIGAHGLPWCWSIYRYLPGQTVAAVGKFLSASDVAAKLTQFLRAFQKISTVGGPLPGPENFYRGACLSMYDSQARRAIELLENKIDTVVATKIWAHALQNNWTGAPVWVHGDVTAGNLLALDGELSAIIDFGQLAIGDPACDLAIAWGFFSGDSRRVFRGGLNFDDGTWARGRGWALWKSMIVATELCGASAVERHRSLEIIDDILLEDEQALA